MSKDSLWYSVWKWYVGRNLEVFFHRMEVTGQENIPKGKPVIFASNHTNALMDPLVINFFSPFQDYFMTRGDVFKIKPVGALFRSWRMLPIFRMKDGIDTLAQNNPVMEFVIEQLTKGHSMIIFPEGSHFWTRDVHPLKKGLVRMAFDVLERKPDSELMVVPVGLYYNDMININRDVLVNFGKPISVRDFPRDENAQKTYQSFNKILRSEMKKLVVCIEKTDLYDKKEHWRSQLEKQLRHLPLKETFDIQQQLIDEIEKTERENPLVFENTSSLDDLFQLPEFKHWLQKTETLLQNAPGDSRWLYALKMPLYLLSLLHFLPVKWIGKSILSKAKDRTFHNSIKFGLGLLIQPLIALILALVIALVFSSFWYGLAYLLLIPVWATFFVELQGRKNYEF